MRATLARFEPMIVRFDASMPDLATKAELADELGKLNLWSVLTALFAAYGAGLAAIAVLRLTAAARR